MVRMSAEERRESVVRAAISEFAVGGYNGTSTEAIARRVGVSQPYLFRLYKNKRELFLAATRRCMEDMVAVFAGALEKSPDGDPETVMATAYFQLIGDREKLLMQMQVYVAVATAEAAGDAEFGETVRRNWLEIWDLASSALGGDRERVGRFMSYGMLINTLVSLGFPDDHRVWQSCFDMTPGSAAE
ncbi:MULTISPECIES: TetR/AcrR family transcriptional regulator [Streptomyces]|uniref:TetR/AcrR family transcriptional regulator n=1 Tax=Streptomyces tsukubensis (strain DSM 42081 / NBRC 108919 / NRRL 18488 / 9993) TaxID=1114943 RepID=I2N4C8_STRT9|nr:MULTISPECIES: TetR/AcrR family transcriptional regulator [Streptomyces]AZK95908.1 TetR family transcriptional regulator [Streptomyces tsukubensis]EIF91875.1 TetR family transcriptional regulator [Streptomyces tsukubensis NRRL18488]MYS68551.1 TetR family transcriptional regulator [Streptomyces sp. SID5473]QKM68073.1 TetR/AcrR family transcriptional regulator [Streptomyces tsukubensis NRRL18488]TAI44473.1 TetR/AcrR family transcriptional regulator [Streptomyces tsukubensis]